MTLSSASQILILAVAAFLSELSRYIWDQFGKQMHQLCATLGQSKLTLEVTPQAQGKSPRRRMENRETRPWNRVTPLPSCSHRNPSVEERVEQTFLVIEA